MSCPQPAAHDPGYGILGRERQAIHRLNNMAACEGWSQGGLPRPEVVRPCCVGFFTRSVLSHPSRLTPALSGGVTNRIHQQWGEGVSLKSKKSVSFAFDL